MSFNVWYNRVRMSLALTKHDVAEIMRIADLPCSTSEIEGWQRRTDDSRRHRTMTEQQFDAFTRGLVDWARDNMER